MEMRPRAAGMSAIRHTAWQVLLPAPSACQEHLARFLACQVALPPVCPPAGSRQLIRRVAGSTTPIVGRARPVGRLRQPQQHQFCLLVGSRPPTRPAAGHSTPIARRARRVGHRRKPQSPQHRAPLQRRLASLRDGNTAPTPAAARSIISTVQQVRRLGRRPQPWQHQHHARQNLCRAQRRNSPRQLQCRTQLQNPAVYPRVGSRPLTLPVAKHTTSIVALAPRAGRPPKNARFVVSPSARALQESQATPCGTAAECWYSTWLFKGAFDVRVGTQGPPAPALALGGL
mmetsp:Transcript_46002/g.127750  ORF Transcript_46002/g.127750 Transcript_46002/m.127750 type:complete len:287 (-) Transcript_46002:231-1091(-)